MLLNKDNAASQTESTKRVPTVLQTQLEACPAGWQWFPLLSMDGLLLKTPNNPPVNRQSIQIMRRFLSGLAMQFRSTPFSPHTQLGNALCDCKAQKQEQRKGAKP
jgi:hypothetical protein